MGALTLNLNGAEYPVNQSRLDKMMNAENKNDAIYMGLWDRFKDIFRTEKKEEMLSTLYDLLHSEQQGKPESETNGIHKRCDLGAVTTFERLKQCANEAHQHLFIMYIIDNKIKFCIGQKVIKEMSVIDVLKNVSIGGLNLIDNYSSILRRFSMESCGKSGPDASDLRRTSGSFYGAYPELKDFFTSINILDNDNFDALYDSLNEPGVDEDKIGIRQMSLSNIFNHLSVPVAYYHEGDR